jgi:hypothetical protein
MHVLGFVAFIAGWLRGGHPERFGVAVLIISYMVSSQTYRWRVDDVYWAAAVQDVVLVMVFGQLALRSNRWWPAGMAALFTLVVLVHLLTVFDPNLTRYAATSAQVGLNSLINLTLLAGVFERWLAGERPASDRATWRPRQLRAKP